MSLSEKIKIFKELLKTAPNGQWSLEKAWVKDENESTPAKNLRASHPTLGNALYPPNKEQYKNSNKVLQTKNKIAIDDTMDLIGKDALHESSLSEFIRKAPKGSIDFGHIFDKVKGNPDLKGVVRSSDFIDGLNHHLNGVRDLKDIHDHHGGLDAVEGVLKHYHGANGVPTQYSSLNFGKHNKKIHAESQSLVGGTIFDDEPNQNLPEYEYDPRLHKETLDSWDSWMDALDEDHESPKADQEMKRHGRSAINRAMHSFKNYHKL